MATAQVLSHYGGAGLQLSGAAAGVKIYDGAAYKQIKFGPAGSGPGGVGRAIYID